MPHVLMDDLQDTADVQRLIDAFYAKARHDPALAHFFTHVDWAHHTPRIVAFWDSLLFGSGSYPGDVMTPHVRLNERLPMERQHFERWVELFTGTVDELFAGPKAEEARSRARNIAAVMVHRIAKQG